MVGVAVDAAHLGSVRRLREPEPGAAEQLFRELLPERVVDAYLELLEQGARPMREGDPADEELVSRHLCYLQFEPGPVLRAIDPLVAINGLLTEVHRNVAKNARIHELRIAHDRDEFHVRKYVALHVNPGRDFGELHAFGRAAEDAALGDIEHGLSAFGGIGAVVADQVADHRHDRVHGLGDPRLSRGRQRPQRHSPAS